MKRLAAASAALLATTALANAGGIERSNQSMAILFEEGTYLEFGLTLVDPSVSGVDGGGDPSGDMAPAFTSPSISYRQDLSDNLSFAFILDTHVGADTEYATGTAYTATGTNADLNGTAFTALLRYEMDNNFSVYGGLRLSDLSGTAFVNFIPFTLDVDGGQELGYVLGAAYEIPEIALRVALTYNSAITHTFTGTGGGFDSTIPQSVMLEAQSGIAEDTLLFGSIRWVDWSEFELTPPALGGASLVDYENDTTTYTLGVGRRFNENWSGALSVVHEDEVGNATNLGPADGRTGVGLGLTWENEQFEISGGLQYSWLADTDPSLGAFRDNTNLAAGLRIGLRF